MSTLIYPSLVTLGLSSYRTPTFSTRTQVSVSGKETRLSDWSLPRYTYEHTYEVLRQNDSYREMETLQSFFLEVRGAQDTWLYFDDQTPDNTVTDQSIGIGNGSTTTYQLVRTFGLGLATSWVDPILAPKTIINIKVNGSVADPSTYTVTGWGTTNPGVVTFIGAPANGYTITASLSYYIPCHFIDDGVQFERFMNNLYTVKSLKFISVK